MNSNIPIGYNEDGEYIGYGYSEIDNKEQRFVKVPLTPEEIDIIEDGLTEALIQANFPPADTDKLGVIVSASEKLRLAKIEYEQGNEEIDY
jgi:hypothetical protein